jgi:hypothetical protein
VVPYSVWARPSVERPTRSASLTRACRAADVAVRGPRLGEGEHDLVVGHGAGRDAVVARGGARPTPFGETPEYLVPMGLNEDLNEAMRDCVRCAPGTPRHGRRHGLQSAAGDFAASQVVDVVKGIHGKIRKADFAYVRPAQ